MKVPISYYIYFWLINSLMALGTGFVMGLVATRLMFLLPPSIMGYAWLLVPISPIAFICIYQLYLISFFWGNRRGEFEYTFLEKSAERGHMGAELGSQLKDINRELRMGDPSAAHAKLKSTMNIFSNNFAVGFQYAISCERLGLANEAIAAYETAIKLIPLSATKLINYVNKQISRVKLEGPSKVSSAPGLQYLIY